MNKIAIGLWLMLLLVGCSDGYIMDKTSNGLEYHFFNKNSATPNGDIEDIYSLNISIYNTKSELLFKEFLMFERYQSVYPGDFHEGLSMLGVGDSAVFKLNADSFFYNHGMEKPKGISQPDEMINVHVGAISVHNPLQHLIAMSEKEVLMMNKFVERKKWDVTVDSTGIQYEITVHNPDGAQVKYGDEVSLTYLYYTLNENIIQKTKEGDFWKFTVGDESRISGLSRILPFMKKGERMRAILPFTEAFGPQGMGIQIPAYTSIVIELQVHDIETDE
jgi:FKBP-type peptidyl-prolyl cis-trans isomerase FkpA